MDSVPAPTATTATPFPTMLIVLPSAPIDPTVFRPIVTALPLLSVRVIPGAGEGVGVGVGAGVGVGVGVGGPDGSGLVAVPAPVPQLVPFHCHQRPAVFSCQTAPLTYASSATFAE